MDTIASFIGGLFSHLGSFVNWLFNAPVDPNTGNAEPFNYVVWLTVMGLAIFLSVYYWVEGRRKIPWIKDHTIWKRIVLDRLLGYPQQTGFGQLASWGAVGLILVGFRWALNSSASFFSWRIWLALWVAWGIGIAGYWVYYFIRQHNAYMVHYHKTLTKAKYMPENNRDKRPAAARR